MAVSADEIFKEPRFSELPFVSRQAVLKALEELDHSGTAAEVASKAALSIQEAERCLQALAIDGGGSMKVYLPPSSSSKLRSCTRALGQRFA
jgi:hypothetical protein